jgi:hypothetical protein
VKSRAGGEVISRESDRLRGFFCGYSGDVFETAGVRLADKNSKKSLAFFTRTKMPDFTIVRDDCFTAEVN